MKRAGEKTDATLGANRVSGGGGNFLLLLCLVRSPSIGVRSQAALKVERMNGGVAVRPPDSVQHFFPSSVLAEWKTD